MTSHPLDGFTSEPHTRARGRAGEDAARAWLEGHGYRVVDQNVTNAAGEIDLVAWEGATLCFLEIKARANADFGPAIEAVTPKKQRRLARAAALYLATLPGEIPTCRFDVLGMDQVGEQWIYTLIQDAFEATGY